jgi:hypothetical protein
LHARAFTAERRAPLSARTISTRPSPLLGTPAASPRGLSGQHRPRRPLRIDGIALGAATQVTSFGPLDLHNRDARGLQVAGQPGAVAAGAFDPGAPHGPEPLGPGDQVAVALRGCRCLRLAQALAQVVEDYRHVEIQVSVHAQHHLRPCRVTRSARAVCRHPPSSSRSSRQSSPQARRSADDTVRGHQMRPASSYEVTLPRSS